jgi:hypothetical protein
MPLNMERGALTFNRPQEPVAPYPYTTREVTINNAAAGVTLAGTLTYPTVLQAGQRVPVVLMVTGSGPQSRDEEVFHTQAIPGAVRLSGAATALPRCATTNRGQASRRATTQRPPAATWLMMPPAD